MSVKQERVAQIILKDVTDIIQFSLKDPSVGFVTITDVQVTNDYSYATIYVCDIRMEVHRLHMLARLFRHRNKQRWHPESFQAPHHISSLANNDDLLHQEYGHQIHKPLELTRSINR